MTGWPGAAELVNGQGTAPVVLVCEHASAFIPADLNDLGLDAADRHAHAVWDIGARDMAVALAEALDAPLVAGALSRLVYDCNRPPSAHDSVPEASELISAPGNHGLSDAERARRVAVHDQFHKTVAQVLDRAQTRHGDHVALVTLHSFTPIYFGVRRGVEIGFLNDDDDRLALACCDVARTDALGVVEQNAPYGKVDGVTYTLAKHAIARGIRNVMIEVRNDLIATPQEAQAMGLALARVLDTALARTADEVAR
ncbi:N-formylglutamate amidohydrolase [Mesobacterium sp. TK19101]|uniref:N-formylglutamate amidohydrolase n=1 Tax=Mesobacterium hydrothermale TaxID=3111907 RepID=A0ABU6HFB5_9RHOB|nr:N-formylglutamate amidohydrolase [Mesobacterium sp. TK19101]MEC3861167.1 N-formylglutamate amidohydrolase [Mesobacterium sp. TK19101]